MKTLQQQGLLRTYDLLPLANFVEDGEEDVPEFCILETIYYTVTTGRLKHPAKIWTSRLIGPYRTFEHAHRDLERFRAELANHITEELRQLI